MAERFELRTRHQFAGLIERRDRWILIRDQPGRRARFEQLTGLEWARQNHSLEAACRSGASEEGRRMIRCLIRSCRCHLAAAQTLAALRR